jgi:hypothetical protein
MQNKGVWAIAHEAVDAYITFKTAKTAINLRTFFPQMLNFKNVLAVT